MHSFRSPAFFAFLAPFQSTIKLSWMHDQQRTHTSPPRLMSGAPGCMTSKIVQYDTSPLPQRPSLEPPQTLTDDDTWMRLRNGYPRLHIQQGNYQRCARRYHRAAWRLVSDPKRTFTQRQSCCGGHVCISRVSFSLFECLVNCCIFRIFSSNVFGNYDVSKIPNEEMLTLRLSSSKEDYSWVKKLRVPRMAVIPYIADNTSALYHAQKNKGHEAMMYHQYFFDFYDNLPDISILIHSQQLSWHVDGLLEQSMIFTLNHLDLREVQRRQFLNLRVTWGIGCSTGSINTTRVNEESGTAPEQKEMQEVSKSSRPNLSPRNNFVSETKKAILVYALRDCSQGPK
jgi:hypothetical protein